MDRTKNIGFTSIGIVLLFIISCSNPNRNDHVSAENFPEEELGWHLGSQAYTFHHFDFFESIDKIDSCGLKYVEAFPGQEIGGGINGKIDAKMDESTIIKILDKLKDKGIQMLSFGVVSPDNEADWRQLFEFGKRMGIETFTSEPDQKFIPLISELCDKYQINVAIHNHPSPRNYWNPDMVLAAVKGQSKRLGACADVGHWVRSGLDATECLKKLEGRILQLHMKDLNDKTHDEDRDVHWGTGIVNVKSVVDELKRQNFKGVISVEYENNWLNNVPDVTASVKYFRNSFNQESN